MFTVTAVAAERVHNFEAVDANRVVYSIAVLLTEMRGTETMTLVIRKDGE